MSDGLASVRKTGGVMMALMIFFDFELSDFGVLFRTVFCTRRNEV
jgi:hypothetical protein